MEDAAEQCGIPINEVFQYVVERSEAIDTLDFQLRLLGQGSIRNGLGKLTELATSAPREGKDLESTDLEAARALVKFGLDALKLSRVKAPGKEADTEGKKDLFDVAQPDPWNLKKPE